MLELSPESLTDLLVFCREEACVLNIHEQVCGGRARALNHPQGQVRFDRSTLVLAKTGSKLKELWFGGIVFPFFLN